MMNLRNNKLILFAFLLLVNINVCYGNEINVVENKLTVIDISFSDLNLIKLPYAGAKVYTANQNIHVQVEGKNLFVLYTGNTPSPVSSYIMLGDNSYPILFTPKSIPSVTVVLNIRDHISPVSSIEEDVYTGDTYTTHLRDVIRALYMRVPLDGYSQKDVVLDTTRWKGTKQYMILEQKGSFYSGELHLLKNMTEESIFLTPNVFWEPGVVAVSLTDREIKPNEVTEIMIVRKGKSFRSSTPNFDVYERTKAK